MKTTVGDLIRGAMNAPSYLYSHEIFKNAIMKYGSKKVSEAAFHQHGYLDIETFQMLLLQLDKNLK